VPVQPDALWQIGSNTKAFTSVLLLQLEAERRLSIDDRLGRGCRSTRSGPASPSGDCSP
jgi:CubicO group peptidase (beta-lactamase class C family)